MLKLKGHDEKLSNLGKIGDNETNISSNLGKIGANESAISSNLTKLNNLNLKVNAKILDWLLREAFNISLNIVISSKLNNIKNNTSIKIKKDIYEKTFTILNTSTNYNSKKIADMYIKSNFTTYVIIKINANYNYSYDNSNNFSHIYKFYNNNQKFKEIKLDHNKTLNVMNDKFNLPGVNSTRINLLIYLISNNNNNSSADLFDYNTVKITYNDNVDTSKIDMNTDNISSNLGKIGTNETNISSNLSKINTNVTNISSNLSKINTNETNISSNLEKIDTNETNISSNLTKIKDIISNKTYLKNVYNVLFYDERTQIDLKNLFYEKVFDINSNPNDFIEIDFKMS